MTARAKLAASLAIVFGSAAPLAACGSKGIQLARSDPNYRGAVLFRDHCSGCHTLDVVGAQGSANKVKDRLRTSGPNFNQRKEQPNQVLYAIHNGGFSGAIMPENILVGQDAVDLANFLSRYSGLKVQQTPGSGSQQASGPSGQ